MDSQFGGIEVQPQGPASGGSQFGGIPVAREDATQKPSGPQPWWDKLSDRLEELNNHLEQGIGDVGRGVWEMGKRIALPPEDTRGKIARMVAGPLGPIISDVLMSHIQTAQKGGQAAQQGHPVIGALYQGAAGLPLVGPGVADMAETAFGTPPTYEGGRQVDPGQPAQPGRAAGQLLGNVMVGGLTEGALETTGAVADAGRAVKTNLQNKYLKSTLNPVEQAAVDYARGPGQPGQGTAPRIQLSPGSITGNKYLQAQEALAQNRPFGATEGAQFRRGTEADIQTDARRLMEQAHPTPTTPESVGRAVNAKLDTTATSMANILVDRAHPTAVTPESVGRAIPAKIDRMIRDLSSQRDAAYQDAWLGRGEDAQTYSVPVRTRQVPVLDAAGKPTGQMTAEPVLAKVNMPVDVRQLKAQAAPILEEMDWMPAADKASSAGYRALQKIVEGDDFIPAWAAEKGLSGLKDMARMAPSEGVRDTGQGVAASLISDLQQGIDAAVARAGPDAIRGLQQGRAIHANIMDIEDVGKQLRAKEPVQNFGRLVNQGDTGADFLRKVQRLAPEQMQPAGRALLQQIVENGDRGKWSALGPETKKILFPDAGLRAGVEHYLDVSDVVKQLKDNKPVQNFGRLVQPHDLSIDFLRDVTNLAPEFREPLGRAWVQQKFERAMREGGFSKTTGLLNDWRELGDLTKRILFPRATLRASLDNLFKVADMASHAPNPSGTALVAGSDSWNPGKIIAGYIGSKALFTPEGIRLLTQAGNPINPGAAAFAAARLRAKFGPPIAIGATGASQMETGKTTQDTRPPLSNFHRP